MLALPAFLSLMRTTERLKFVNMQLLGITGDDIGHAVIELKVGSRMNGVAQVAAVLECVKNLLSELRGERFTACETILYVGICGQLVDRHARARVRVLAHRGLQPYTVFLQVLSCARR